jgi:hypothetical protein
MAHESRIGEVGWGSAGDGERLRGLSDTEAPDLATMGWFIRTELRTDPQKCHEIPIPHIHNRQTRRP